MPSEPRIYRVNGPEKPRLVPAGNKTAAFRHVAEDTLTVGLATQDDLVTLIADGIKVETAGAEEWPDS